MNESLDRKTGVLVCGHGSRDNDATVEFGSLAVKLRQRLSYPFVESGHLEFARPTIREALDTLRAAGARRVLAVPGMLFAAGHVKNDIPWELNSFSAEHPEMTIEFGRELAIDPKLLAAAGDRIAAAEATSPRQVAREDTMLVVVGRGTNDPDANGDVAKIGRMLWEGMGFGWGAVAYSGVAHPRVAAALTRAVRLGFRRIIVFPYFLFTGVLVKRIYAEVDQVAALNNDVEFVKARYLADHDKVIEAFAERVQEILTGENHMNCRLCKYREQVIGYEGAVGQPQAGHHLHVRGIGTDPHTHTHDHGHHHHHGDGHAHTHTHHHDD
jgi:sirohydrochlorin cobaltochelatase